MVGLRFDAILEKIRSGERRVLASRFLVGNVVKVWPSGVKDFENRPVVIQISNRAADHDPTLVAHAFRILREFTRDTNYLEIRCRPD
jgi:hypothetical protein